MGRAELTNFQILISRREKALNCQSIAVHYYRNWDFKCKRQNPENVLTIIWFKFVLTKSIKISVVYKPI